jgi:hypothetical protein
MAVILSFSYYEYYKSEIECFRCTAVLFSWLFFQSDNFQLNCKLREIYVEKGGSHSNTLLHQKYWRIEPKKISSLLYQWFSLHFATININILPLDEGVRVD